jgi:mono/diheme cytochrome c family protein
MVNTRIWQASSVLVLWLAGSHVALGQDKAQIERGMKAYTEQKCSICHSIAGKGNAKGKLDDVASTLTPEEIRAWLVSPAEMAKKIKAERKPPMKAYASLSKEDLDGLVAYLGSLKKK